MEPTVIPRSDHSVSRRQIDLDALKVLYRLRQFDHAAYLVGGSVRDLLLGRPPKDFDIGTSAHPYQVKRLFRNCWIIGRRFRLAHIKFGTKTIEVATFRRQMLDASPTEAGPAASTHQAGVERGAETREDHDQAPHEHLRHGRPHETQRPVQRDNTFGTAEEDAFRRDFTINGLFYDVATSSIIDYVGGLRDLKTHLIRCIGDPDKRFQEDPIRMLRAVAFAARLGFHIDPTTYDAIRRHCAAIGLSSPARLLEELYKILRSGASKRTFRMLAEVGLLEHVTPETGHHQADPLWRSLAELDLYRGRFQTAPDTLTNPILLGSLLAPTRNVEHRPWETSGHRNLDDDPQITLGTLPLARRHVQRLRQIVGLQRPLLDPGLPYRAQRALMHRDVCQEALTWLEIHGRSSEAVQRWRSLGEIGGATFDHGNPRRRRRRRRARRRSPRPSQP